MYIVILKPSAERAFEKLSKDVQTQIISVLVQLESDAKPHGSKKLEGSTGLRRMRTGDYRVIYALPDADQVIFVPLVGHRREVYRRLDRLR